MLMVCIHSYLKSVLSCDFILSTYHRDTIFTWTSIWGSVVIFRSQNGSASKMFGKHCSRDQSFYLPTDAQESFFKRILKFTLKQLLHVSVRSPSSRSVFFELAKVIIIKIITTMYFNGLF